MDQILLIAGSCAALLVMLIGLLTLLKKSSGGAGDNVEVDVPAAAAGIPRQRAQRAGGVRRRGARQRMQDTQQGQDEDSGEEDPLHDIALPEGKIGAKKLKKLQDKAEKKSQREAEFQERQERKQREALLDEQRKQEDKRQQQEDKLRELEEQKIKEEEERKEYEEYLKLKEAFSVEEEGTEEVTAEDAESLLQQFIDYIKEMKVIMLEDLALHFKMKTQEVIDRISSLQEGGLLTGVLDDRGKFIYITEEEYEAVARFIKQRGRVSISELAESSNRLINMNPDNKEVHRKLMSEAIVG